MTKDADEIRLWKGRRLEEMSKEDLIVALKTIGRLYHQVLHARRFGRHSI